MNRNYKIILTNFISLGMLKGVNLILPLVTFPYLVRILGIENFGLLTFANATIAYFQVITNYGFDLSATKQVSFARGKKKN